MKQQIIEEMFGQNCREDVTTVAKDEAERGEEKKRLEIPERNQRTET